MKNTEEDNKDIGGIARKISDGFYINVNRIPTHHIDYDQEALEALGYLPSDDAFEKMMKDNLQDTDSIPTDKDQGNDTIGIP